MMMWWKKPVKRTGGDRESPMKRVGLVSFMHESNTFNRTPTGRKMFEVVRGSELVREWQDSFHEIGGMVERARQLGAELVPLLSAYGEPLGPVERELYEDFVGEIVRCLRSERLDGLLLSLHGAMVAEHVRDADGETAARIRQAVGPVLPIVLTLDLHANVSARMIANVTATTIYRTNPHLDQRERGCEAAELLMRILNGEVRPVQALEKPPLMIPILAQNTAAEPLAGIYARLEQLIRTPGILSASFALGYPYADVEEVGPAFLVVGRRRSSGSGKGRFPRPSGLGRSRLVHPVRHAGGAGGPRGREQQPYAGHYPRRGRQPWRREPRGWHRRLRRHPAGWHPRGPGNPL